MFDSKVIEPDSVETRARTKSMRSPLLGGDDRRIFFGWAFVCQTVGVGFT